MSMYHLLDKIIFVGSYSFEDGLSQDVRFQYRVGRNSVSIKVMEYPLIFITRRVTDFIDTVKHFCMPKLFGCIWLVLCESLVLRICSVALEDKRNILSCISFSN